jgi:hypothetical protein
MRSLIILFFLMVVVAADPLRRLAELRVASIMPIPLNETIIPDGMTLEEVLSQKNHSKNSSNITSYNSYVM